MCISWCYYCTVSDHSCGSLWPYLCVLKWSHLKAPCEKLDPKQGCLLTPSCLFVFDIFMLFTLFAPFCSSSAPNTVYWGFSAFVFLISFSGCPVFCSSLSCSCLGPRYFFLYLNASYVLHNLFLSCWSHWSHTHGKKLMHFVWHSIATLQSAYICSLLTLFQHAHIC